MSQNVKKNPPSGIERERRMHLKTTAFVKKNSAPRIERERNASLLAMQLNPVHKREKTTFPSKKSGISVSLQNERERRHFDGASAKKTISETKENSKKTGGVAAYHKTDGVSRPTKAGSNKHVDSNTNISNHNDIGKHCNTSHSMPEKSEDTNLNAKGQLPAFLTNKSLPSEAAVRSAFCDKLAITFDCDPDNQLSFQEKAKRLEDSGDDHYKLIPVYQEDAKIYRYSYRLVERRGVHVAFLQASPRQRSVRFCRLEFNPNQVDSLGYAEIRRMLRALVGSNFRMNLSEGKITRLDAATDIKKIRPGDLLITSDRSRDSSLWVRHFNRAGHEEWETETVALGSANSDYFAQIYDKGAQLFRVKGIEIDALRTRIEVRTKPRDRQGVSIAVKDIRKVRNPFASIHIAFYPGEDEKDYLFNFLVCACRWYGAEEACRMIKDRSLRARYWNKLINEVPEWWNPDGLWTQVIDSLKATGIFSDTIFDE